MYALRQIIDDPQEFIPVPPALRHRKIEVIFLAQDEPKPLSPSEPDFSLADLAGCWEGELERSQQGEYETRLELD